MPPGIHAEWFENCPWNQALIIGYGQVRDIEEMEQQIATMKSMVGR